MMTPWNIIYALENTDSRNDKQDILSTVAHDNEFWSIIAYGLSSYITFGVKELPVPETFGDGVVSGQFKVLADKLANRQLTGHAALAAIKTFAESCTELQWNYWYKRLLSKDMKCGMGVSTFNKVAPDKFKVPVFECQLASPMKKVKTNKLPTSAIMEAKYDGERALFFLYSDRTYDILSRNGFPYYNFNSVGDQLITVVDLPGFPKEGIVIDGEIISKTFSDLQGQARRKTDAKFEGLFMAFDTLTIPEFKEQLTTAPLRQRRATLDNLVKYVQAHNENCLIELSYGVDGINPQVDEDTIMEFYQQQVEAGWEGIVLKNLDAPYVFKRSNDWLKMKPSDTFDLTVDECVEGEGRLVGTLGAFACSGVTHDGKTLQASVGTGLSDAMRAAFWADRVNMRKMIIEVEADSVSQNKDGTYSLRFPRFKKVRLDLVER